MDNLAALHRDVVFGRSGGRIIWQPRIGCWYDDKKIAGEPLPAPYEGMSIPEIHRRSAARRGSISSIAASSASNTMPSAPCDGH
jgi:hypothetical protein